MAFHIRDPKTDQLVRELATKRGIGITEAVREPVENVAGVDDLGPLLQPRGAARLAGPLSGVAAGAAVD